MNGSIVEKEVFNRKIFIYLPEEYYLNNRKYPIIYVNDGDKFTEILPQLMEDIEDKFKTGALEENIIVGISPIDRLSEYTPWFSKALNEKFKDFGGRADDYLEFLNKNLNKYIEDNFRVKDDKNNRKIMGYSLGGLVSLYSIYKNNDYGKIASICASQWYENWIDFIEKQNMINESFKLIIIAGKKEGSRKNTIHKYSPKFSEDSYEIFKRKIGEKNVNLIWDEYDHHQNVLNRYKTALEFLLNNR